MKVELFQSAGCKRCAAARDELKALAERTIPGVEWRIVDAAAEVDYAVSVGVMNLPAVAVDGQLVFSSLPTSGQLSRELLRTSQVGGHGR